MNKLIENCLFKCDREKFKQLKLKVAQINVTCNGNNIVQDDIFNLVRNYARQNNTPLDILRYPISDMELCACTFLREGRIFVFVNAVIPLRKQIFASAHELYHIICYFEGLDPDYSRKGSILEAGVIDAMDIEMEDMMANAFAGLLLAPDEMIRSQMEIYGLEQGKMDNRSVYILMDIFAIPYKAMILRLFEEGILDEKKAEDFLDVPEKQIEKEISLYGIGRRWQKSTKDLLEFGSLEENLEVNQNLGFVVDERMAEDKETLEKLKKILMESGTQYE